MATKDVSVTVKIEMQPQIEMPVTTAETENIQLEHKDVAMLKDDHRKEVMKWMESRYPVLADVIKTTKTSTSFHLAEENKEEFPHDDAIKVTEEMSRKYLILSDGDDHDHDGDSDYLPKKRATYLESMFMCVTPESLTPLAAMMYQKFEEMCPDYLQEVKRYHDEKKVMQLSTCLLVRGIPAEQIWDNKIIQTTMQKLVSREGHYDDRLPEQLLVALTTAEDVERSFYIAYRDWREIPQSHAVHITEAMVKHLEGDDDERKEYLMSLFFSLGYHRLLPLAITMFQKYREVCPDKIELMTSFAAYTRYHEHKYLGRVLLRRSLLSKEEYDTLFLSDPQQQQELLKEQDYENTHEHTKNLKAAYKEIVKDPHGSDMLNYFSYYTDIFYDDAAVVGKLMLPYLYGDEQQRKLYLETMSSITLMETMDWLGKRCTVYTGIIMCQQYIDRYPGHLREQHCFSQQYLIFLLIWKEMWKSNLLSEAAMSSYIQTVLHQHDNPRNYIAFLYLLDSLPTTVYMPVLVNTPEASDFSMTKWIQPLKLPQERTSESGVEYHRFVRILVTAALAREEEAHPYEAPHHVLLKALKNDTLSGSKVDSLLDALLQIPDHDEVILPPMCTEDILPIVAARRGPQFIPVTCKLMENSGMWLKMLLHKLVVDESSDDNTVAEIIDEVVKSHPVEDFNALMSECSMHSGRTVTATVIWRYAYHNLNFYDHVLSVAVSEDVPLAILEEFNIDLYSNVHWGNDGNNPLYFAAEKGFTKFTKLALNRGFANLLKYSNREGQLMVEIAMKCEHYGTAAVMLKEMNDYKLCIAKYDADGETQLKINFRVLLEELLKKKDKETREDIRECVVAILNTTVDQDTGMIHHEVLEVDYEGYTPDKDEFKCHSQHSIELVVKNAEILKDVFLHESFLSLVNYKWKSYGGKLFLVPFLSYLFFLAFLTMSFVLGATKGNPSEYSEPLDGFRLYCEIVVLLMTIVDILLEIRDYWTNYNRKLRAYFSDWTNWLDILAILITLLIIPFRIANLNVQWVFVALAYILHTLRISEYAVIKSYVAIYVEILVRIIIRDVLQFLIVFIVIAVSFGGGLYFSLLAEPCKLPQNTTGTGFSPATNTSLCLHPDETSEIYLSWLTGLRLLLEGNVINPFIFGDQGFWWFSVVIYSVFLFVVAVIMLNLLIAQFSKSYEEVTESARVSVTQNRAKILTTLQSSLWVQLAYYLYRKLKKQEKRNILSFPIFYRATSPYKTTYDNEYGKIYKHLQSSSITDQKQFNVVKELQTQLKEVKTDLDSKISSEMTKQATAVETLMTKQAETLTVQVKTVQSNLVAQSKLAENITAQVETVRSDLVTQSEVVKQLQSDVIHLVTALREQTEMVMEQQRQMKESWKSFGEVKDILQQLIQK